MRRLAVLVVLPLLAGCMGEERAATIEPGEIRRLVLRAQDLPPVFEQFDEGRQVRADQPEGTRSNPDRFGREDGWKARYRRAGTAETRGPLIVESRVDVFAEPAGASDELEAARLELEEAAETQGEVRLLERPSIGADAFAATILQPSGGGGVRNVRFYLVAWREANVTAAVFTNGFDGKITLGQTLDLARKQQRRIAVAAES